MAPRGSMFAISVRQPWAQAIAHFGKNVENRSRRPPAHLMGQRVAIHVSQSGDTLWELSGWREHVAAVGCGGLSKHEHRVCEIAEGLDDGSGIVPHAGRVIATARLVGCCWRDANGEPVGRTPNAGFGDDETLVVEALGSPWFTGPVGWVLGDLRVLEAPVGPVRGQVYPFALPENIANAVIAAGG